LLKTTLNSNQPTYNKTYTDTMVWPGGVMVKALDF